MNTTSDADRRADGAIAILSFDRPRPSTPSIAALRELHEALAGWAARRTATARPVLTGAGEKAFVAGADIAEMAPMTAWVPRENSLSGQAPAELLESLRSRPSLR